MDFNSFNGSGQSSYGQTKISAPYVAVIALFILAFATIWMTWISLEVGMKIDKYGGSESETLDFTDIMDSDEEYSEYSSRYGYTESNNDMISRSDYDAINNSYKAMKYSGIAGYIMLAAAFVCLFVKRKAMLAASALATLAFAVSMISGINYCSKTESYINDLMKKYIGDIVKINLDFHISAGLIVALGASAAVTALGYMLMKNEGNDTPDYY